MKFQRVPIEHPNERQHAPLDRGTHTEEVAMPVPIIMHAAFSSLSHEVKLMLIDAEIDALIAGRH